MLIETIKDTEAAFLKHYTLHLSLDQERERRVVDLLNETCLPDFKSVHLDHINWVEELKLLRLLSSPSERLIQSFYISSLNWSKYISDGNRTGFFSLVSKWAQKTQLEFKVQNMAISGKELSELLKASRNWQTVSFWECKIDATSTDFDFNIPQKYKVQHLHFTYWGRKDRSNWAVNFEQFKSLVCAISKSGLSDSLQYIYLYSCQLSKKQAATIFKKYKIRHVGFVCN